MISQICGVIFASLNATLFFILLVIFKNKILKYVGARWYYYLWFSIFIPWISIWLPFDFTLTNSPLLNITAFVRQIDVLVVEFFMKYKSSPINLVIYFWFTGVFLTIFYIGYHHIRFMLNIKEKSTPLTLTQQKIARVALKNKHLIPLSRIYVTPLVSSPLICHVINSKIYLPEDFFRQYNANEKSYVLQHEAIHFQRCDLLANASMIILVCLNWFNPLFFYAYRYFRGAQELSCDALLSQQYSMFDSRAYSYALLKTAVTQTSQSALSCPWNTGSQLKERCLAMKFHQMNPVKNLLGVLLLSISFSLALAALSLETHLFFADLRISNFSKVKFTVIGNFKCENKLAVIEKNSVTLISQASIQNICNKSSWPLCTIEFHQADNCSDEPIASVGLTLQGSIAEIKSDKQYNVSGKDYNLLFYGNFIPNS